jgi:type I restriction enzyme, R subunit
MFDTRVRPEPKITKAQALDVKKVVRDLFEPLKREKLVLDWRKEERTRQAVRLWIEQKLDELP